MSRTDSPRLRQLCLEYPYDRLEEATAGFHESRRLGAGTAGTVYRGEMPDGSDVAVKVIDLEALGEDAAVSGFEDEIATLSRFRHPNLVVLIGWARRDTRRFLVYEFLSEGDVQQRLRKCKEPGGRPFLWHERLAAARDAATGLAHLHNGLPRAFHRDVKSANILLGSGGAKMADFGLSCMAKTSKDKDLLCEFPSGTPGYTCPTYIKTGKVTEGSEVYSFGTVLLELLLNLMPAGRLGGEILYPIKEAVAPDQPGAAQRCLQALDSTARWPLAAAAEVASLALACVDPDDGQRPLFNEVCRGLRGILDRFPPDDAEVNPATPIRIVYVSKPVPGAASPAAEQQGRRPQQDQASTPAAAKPVVRAGGEAPSTYLVVADAAEAPADAHPPANVQADSARRHAELARALDARLPDGIRAPRAQTPQRAEMRRPSKGAVALDVAAPVVAQAALGTPRTRGATGQTLVSKPAALTVRACEASTPRPDVDGPVPQASVPQQPPRAAGPAWPRGSDVLLEVVQACGADLAALPRHVRSLLLSPAADNSGCRVAQLGRHFQAEWFEALLADPTSRQSVSRHACDIAWGGSVCSSPPVLRTLGSNLLTVDEFVVKREQQVALQPGSRISFMFKQSDGELGIALTLAVRCTGGVLSVPTPSRPSRPATPTPRADSLARCITPRQRQSGASPSGLPGEAKKIGITPDRRRRLVPASSGRAGRLGDGQEHWELECIFAAGLRHDALVAAVGAARSFRFALGLGGATVSVGRQQQVAVFEALLAHQPELLGFVSRSHLQLESDGNGGITVTNLSQNVVIKNTANLLNRGDVANVGVNDTLSFAAQVELMRGVGLDTAAKGGRGSEEGHNPREKVSIAPFLTFRLSLVAAPESSATSPPCSACTPRQACDGMALPT